MTNDRIKELALANGFKLKDQGMGGMDLNPYVYAFARALLAEHKSWQPLTGKMLEQFELKGSGECLLKDTEGCNYYGHYEWRQGRYPHGFVAGDDWISAMCIVEVIINP